MADKNRLADLQSRLGYQFGRPELLQQALTHASLGSGTGLNNERMEFLGDRVLALLIADLLLVHYPDADEGDLAQRLNALVRRETCTAVAADLQLGACLNLSAAETATGGRDKPAILGDACEALIGALYQDGGMVTARQFVETFWTPRLAGLSAAPGDAKSALQEWSQARKLGTPVYTVTSRAGPDHAPLFEIEVSLPGQRAQTGAGASKRDAERAAALAMLRCVGAGFNALENT